MLCSSIKGFAMPNCRLFHTIEKNILITVKNWWSLTYGQVYIYKTKLRKKKDRLMRPVSIEPVTSLDKMQSDLLD
jgi:hypothetical protein